MRCWMPVRRQLRSAAPTSQTNKASVNDAHSRSTRLVSRPEKQARIHCCGKAPPRVGYANVPERAQCPWQSSRYHHMPGSSGSTKSRAAGELRHYRGSVGATSSLAYSGVTIRDYAEMICRTDMWRASGASLSKRPAEWLRSVAATDFIDYVVGDVGISHHEAIQVVRAGPDTATWAHWQIAFACAKYLSPEFHTWCNSVVRSHIETPPHLAHAPRRLAALIFSTHTLRNP